MVSYVSPVLCTTSCFRTMGPITACRYSNSRSLRRRAQNATVVLAASCPRGQQAPRLDESFMYKVPRSMRCTIAWLNWYSTVL